MGRAHVLRPASAATQTTSFQLAQNLYQSWQTLPLQRLQLSWLALSLPPHFCLDATVSRNTFRCWNSMPLAAHLLLGIKEILSRKPRRPCKAAAFRLANAVSISTAYCCHNLTTLERLNNMSNKASTDEMSQTQATKKRPARLHARQQDVLRPYTRRAYARVTSAKKILEAWALQVSMGHLHAIVQEGQGLKAMRKTWAPSSCIVPSCRNGAYNSCLPMLWMS